MIVIPGAFGIRLEDHVYVTEDGPRWFSNPTVRVTLAARASTAERGE